MTPQRIGVSQRTIQGGEETERVDLPMRMKGTGIVTGFEDAFFREILRLTRFRFQKLVPYLEPLRNSFNDLSKRWGERSCTGNWGGGSYYHYLYCDSEKPLKYFDDASPPPFSVGTHALRVRWRDQEGKVTRGKILLFIDRNSGLFYAKAYTTRIHTRSFALALARFEEMLQDNITSLSFVSTLTKMPDHSLQPLSTVLGFRPAQYPDGLEKGTAKNGQPEGPLNISADSEHLLNEHIAWRSSEPVSLTLDAPTPPQKGAILLPGSFASRMDLDKVLEQLANALNLTSRSYIRRGKRIEVTPVDRLHPYGDPPREVIVKGVKLPRRFTYQWEQAPSDSGSSVG